MAYTVEYDPSIIIAFAEKLYQRADSIVATYAALGVVVGGALGLAIGGPFHNGWVVAFFVACLVGIGSFIAGQGKAFALRLQAQIALCQVQIEANTRVRHGSTPKTCAF